LVWGVSMSGKTLATIIIVLIIIIGLIVIFMRGGLSGTQQTNTGGTAATTNTTQKKGSTASFSCEARWAKPGLMTISSYNNVYIVVNVSDNTATIVEIPLFDALYSLENQGIQVPVSILTDTGTRVLNFLDNATYMYIIGRYAAQNGYIKQVSLDEGLDILAPRGDIQKCGNQAFYYGSLGIAHVTATFKYKGLETVPAPAMAPEDWGYKDAQVAVLYANITNPNTGEPATVYVYIDPNTDIIVAIGLETGGVMTTFPLSNGYHMLSSDSLQALRQGLNS
jgi:hypothetical protein